MEDFLCLLYSSSVFAGKQFWLATFFSETCLIRNLMAHLKPRDVPMAITFLVNARNSSSLLIFNEILACQ